MSLIKCLFINYSEEQIENKIWTYYKLFYDDDEPPNWYIKSKRDIDDPLTLFFHKKLSTTCLICF